MRRKSLDPDTVNWVQYRAKEDAANTYTLDTRRIPIAQNCQERIESLAGLFMVTEASNRKWRIVSVISIIILCVLTGVQTAYAAAPDTLVVIDTAVLEPGEPPPPWTQTASVFAL